MASSTTETPVVKRVRELIEPIVADLRLDLYDIEQRGGTIRVTVDTPVGAGVGVDLDQLALATRLISRELDHEDPVPGKYTLEVTSPGVERTLRTPEHFRREIGKEITVRLANVDAEERRMQGTLVAADDTTVTVRIDESTERVIDLASIDRARTVFEWGPQPKPGGKGSAKGKLAAKQAAPKAANKTSKTQAPAMQTSPPSNKEQS